MFAPPPPPNPKNVPTALRRLFCDCQVHGVASKILNVWGNAGHLNHEYLNIELL